MVRGGDVRSIEADLLANRELYGEVVQRKLAHARESVWIATANVKAMFVDTGSGFRSVLDLFEDLRARGVELRLLHAELPSRPFRAAFERKEALVRGGLCLKICPRVHFKAVVIDRAWAYVGSANLTGAGLGAKSDEKRNFELGFCTEDFDVIDRVTALFEAIWSGAECGRCKLRDVCPDPLGPAVPSRRARVVRLGRSRRLRVERRRRGSRIY